MTSAGNSPVEQDVPRVYVGAYALCLDEPDHLLLCRIKEGYPDAGLWTLPGGGLSWGEPPEEGVLRELEEETGLRPLALGEVAAVYSRAYLRSEERPANSVHHLGVIYRVKGVQGVLRAETDGSTDRCAWVTRAASEHLALVPLARFALPLAWPERRK